MKRRKKGFTLIELMIVIAIIAILAAVLVPNFMRAREASRLTACKSNLKNISTAVETYSNDWDGLYPGGTGGITSATEIRSGQSSGIGALQDDYIQKPTKCPTAKANYYFSQTQSVRYWIYCPAAKQANQSVPKHAKTGGAKGGPILDSQTGINDAVDGKAFATN
jgi:prepilin-type N-terminal cleavage/methylation domain-containing protein